MEKMHSQKPGSVLDLDVALARVDGDWQLLVELSTVFLQDYRRLLDEARNSILRNDAAGLERAAHTLKGRLAFFGIRKAREQCLDLEMMGRRNDFTQARQALAEAEAEMESIVPEFQALVREKST
jgi:HPt (histidine-containing phosphotransfer) domain-containing protein